MTVSRTARLALHRWSEGSDPFTRAQRDADNASLEALVAVDGQGTFSGRPNPAVRGRYYYVDDVGNPNDGILYRDNGRTWVALNRRTQALRVERTFTINGDVFLPSGDTFYVPPFFVPVPTGQTVSLVAARYVIRSGTEAVFDIRENNTVIHASLTGLRATTTPTTATSTAPTQALTNGTALSIVVTGVIGSPKNMSVSLYLDYLA